MPHSPALYSSISPFSSTEPNLWLGAKEAFLVLLGFIVTNEILQASFLFSLGFIVGFGEGIVGTFSDPFLIGLNLWTAPFLAIVSMVGGAWAGFFLSGQKAKVYFNG